MIEIQRGVDRRPVVSKRLQRRANFLDRRGVQSTNSRRREVRAAALLIDGERRQHVVLCPAFDTIDGHIECCRA
ncbi:MAG: hypothetical protein A2W18_06495 [Candidatus Muproteobacteria bacterium RBG_16_60_9]|uniref:Uncharacterized protein n=1 Tax=Candidatus Muproteobacteria bacterium RBG_16_60_9 TaxID=1817755 RepID=A0A1F6V326_9PROT|nr:MAG: hypothetical protein A2W18_06495 [Candidatus Muproteobacteria bacterium RBG_16_60_9]